jgi:hypothetical protein
VQQLAVAADRKADRECEHVSEGAMIHEPANSLFVLGMLAAPLGGSVDRVGRSVPDSSAGAHPWDQMLQMCLSSVI